MHERHGKKEPALGAPSGGGGGLEKGPPGPPIPQNKFFGSPAAAPVGRGAPVLLSLTSNTFPCCLGTSDVDHVLLQTRASVHTRKYQPAHLLSLQGKHSLPRSAHSDQPKGNRHGLCGAHFQSVRRAPSPHRSTDRLQPSEVNMPPTLQERAGGQRCWWRACKRSKGEWLPAPGLGSKRPKARRDVKGTARLRTRSQGHLPHPKPRREGTGRSTPFNCQAHAHVTAQWDNVLRSQKKTNQEAEGNKRQL